VRSRDDHRPPAPGDTEREPARLRTDPRLISDADPSANWAVALLGSVEPASERPGRRQRVWLRLQAGRERTISRLRVAFGAVAVLLCGVLSSAAFAGWPAWLARALGTEPARIIDVTPPRVEGPRRPPRLAPAIGLPAPAPAPAPTLAPTPTSESPSLRGRRASKPALPEDTGPLLEAMRALRVERNPGRARELLTSYLGQHPRGDLAEEALVMLVEAAVAHRDADAQTLAARYYRLYPHGPFRGQVERTLAAYDRRP
jgi:hypothetical protein